MPDALDIDLHDAELGEEISLVAALMVAAAESDGPLSQADVDAVLGRSAPVIPVQPDGHGTRRIRVTSTEPRTPRPPTRSRG